MAPRLAEEVRAFAALTERLAVIESLQTAEDSTQLSGQPLQVGAAGNEQLVEPLRPAAGKHRLAGSGQAQMNTTAVTIVTAPADQPLALEHRQRLRDRPPGDAEIARDGDRDIAVAIRLREIAEHLQMHRQQSMPRCILAYQLLDQRRQAFEDEDSRSHRHNVSPRIIS
ncbi:MAG: hypothetical protein AW07_01647 [Candidatus Accumulibacter sp. SK-11]|nr:MAG: hypothetical protein AW07_01647 [Candidatus Accumulibacter sp. SK-11]